MSIHWRGKAIIAEIDVRTRAAIDATTEETAQEIVTSRWWQSHTESGLVSEVVTEPARRDGLEISGKVGTTRVRGFYGLFLERERPFMRPAADRTFPHLRDRLRGV